MSRHSNGICAGCGFPVGPLNDFKFSNDGRILHRACEIKPTPPTTPTPANVAFNFSQAAA
jgi:hypothetical protein